MSKAVRTDQPFDINLFTTLLKKAQGVRSQTEFAADCGVSLSYMCKYLNRKFSKAPTPSTLKKIALHADNNITLSELLTAAGYSSPKYTYPTQNHSGTKEYKKLAIATIYASLAYSAFKWQSCTPIENSAFDFSINIIDESLDQWIFHYLDFQVPSTDYLFHNRILSYFSQLVYLNLRPRTKFSFLTNDPYLFQQLSQIKPYMLSLLVSVILVDTNKIHNP